MKSFVPRPEYFKMCHYLHAYANTSPNNEDMKEECYRKIKGVDKTHNILRNSKNFFLNFHSDLDFRCRLFDCYLHEFA